MTDADSGVAFDAHPVTAAHALLRATFAEEVAARLPRLQALADGDVEIREDARRDAHTLGSSAIIVDEPEIARLAHAVELGLADGPIADLLTALRSYVA